jgi:hypothetical protein
MMTESAMRGLALGLCAASVALASQRLAAMECPQPPVQANKDWDTQVRAEVGKIGPVRGADLQTRVKSATNDLLTKLPGADKLYLEQMMFSAYCSALRDDKTMSESAKAQQILDYRRQLQASLKP